MELIDLGYDFFLVKLGIREDLDNVINVGPWFMGRRWTPKFRAPEATFGSVAVWIQLLGLPPANTKKDKDPWWADDITMNSE